jgi:hypothetical protein
MWDGEMLPDLDDKLGKLPRQVMRDIDAGLRRVLDL